MPTSTTKPNQRRIVQELLNPVSGEMITPQAAGVTRTSRPASRGVALLERQAPQIVKEAETAGVEIEWLGISPLFAETRLYSGEKTDWIMRPVIDGEDAVVPKRERAALQRLNDAGLSFPIMYSAHEIDKAKTKDIDLTQGPVKVDRKVGTELVGPIPEPIETRELGESLGQRSQQVLRAAAAGARTAGLAALAVAAAPVVLVGAAATGLAAVTMDPIIVGAIPAGLSTAGGPAGFYLLAKWDW